jgi:hypothetical protein
MNIYTIYADIHVAFNSMVDMETIQHFLYRDWPDE